MSACVAGAESGAPQQVATPTRDESATEPGPAENAAPGFRASGVPVARPVTDALDRGEVRRVLVVLDPTDTPSGPDPGKATDAAPPDAPSPCARTASLAPSPRVSSAVAAALDLQRRAPGTELLRTYRHVSAWSLRLHDRAALAAVVALPRARAVLDDVPVPLTLAATLPLVHQPEVIAAGHDGTGVTVAVLDTGADWTRPDLGACSAPGAPGCRVSVARDVAPDDGVRDAHGHGTNVSAIVAGLAPGARIAALDVFDGELAWSSDILAGVEWAIDARTSEHVVAINLSLGGGKYVAPCGGSPLALGIAAARAAGIVTVAASGNEGHVNAIAYPGCVPAALSVGAVYAGHLGPVSFGVCDDPNTAPDRPACFSNTAPFLGLLAPGAPVTAGGYTMYGTSQAAPHVTGAVALLRAAFPSESVDTTLARLSAGGTPVSDPRTGATFRRLDVAGAFAVTPAGSPEPPVDPCP